MSLLSTLTVIASIAVALPSSMAASSVKKCLPSHKFYKYGCERPCVPLTEYLGLEDAPVLHELMDLVERDSKFAAEEWVKHIIADMPVPLEDQFTFFAPFSTPGELSELQELAATTDMATVINVVKNHVVAGRVDLPSIGDSFDPLTTQYMDSEIEVQYHMPTYSEHPMLYVHPVGTDITSKVLESTMSTCSGPLYIVEKLLLPSKYATKMRKTMGSDKMARTSVSVPAAPSMMMYGDELGAYGEVAGVFGYGGYGGYGVDEFGFYGAYGEELDMDSPHYLESGEEADMASPHTVVSGSHPDAVPATPGSTPQTASPGSATPGSATPSSATPGSAPHTAPESSPKTTTPGSVPHTTPESAPKTTTPGSATPVATPGATPGATHHNPALDDVTVHAADHEAGEQTHTGDLEHLGEIDMEEVAFIIEEYNANAPPGEEVLLPTDENGETLPLSPEDLVAIFPDGEIPDGVELPPAAEAALANALLNSEVASQSDRSLVIPENEATSLLSAYSGYAVAAFLTALLVPL